MPHPQIEILGARLRRRRWRIERKLLERKLRAVAETEDPGASGRAVAARHDVYPMTAQFHDDGLHVSADAFARSAVTGTRKLLAEIDRLFRRIAEYIEMRFARHITTLV